MKELQWHRALIIVSAGEGKRFRGGTLKQFLKLDQRWIVHHALEAFISTNLFEQVILALPASHVQSIRKDLQNKVPSSIRFETVRGGATRQESVEKGLGAIQSPCNLVLVHDGVRPFPSRKLIESVVEVAQDQIAAIPVIPVRDTVKQLDKQGHVLKTIPREDFWMAQTPQGFHYTVLKNAHAWGQEKEYKGTDDATLIEKMGIPVKTVPGEVTNIKITTPEDFELAKRLLQGR
ncbi:MAG: 2-C-methyl-D-erythritol 4-phosphate cytidylyltransferase [Deltaproteobacteria bacterium]|nr:2-C-methyl-D-erythritol 4-phosphate cytidylyltransferase [Deltaproteobacteria bacterium]